MVAESKPGGIGSLFGIRSTYRLVPDGRKGCNMQVDLGTTGIGPGLEGAAREIRGSAISLNGFCWLPPDLTLCPPYFTTVSIPLNSPFDSHISLLFVTFRCRSP